MMKKFFVITAFFIALTSQSQEYYKLPEHTKKILFLGNSITYKGDYITQIETYFRINYPTNNYQFINVGLPSETVSGLTEPTHANGLFSRPDLRERLDRILEKIKPDLIFACYGMNDGIYLPFDEQRFQKFKDGIEWMHQKIDTLGIPIIHITPPIYDPKKGEAYANVLELYAAWLMSTKFTKSWKVIDINFPMKSYLLQMRKKDIDFYLAKDGVHPQELGHWLIAKEILQFLGETNVANANSVYETIFHHKNHLEIALLHHQKQQLLKDAWLTYTGHKRPRMKVGLPLDEALQKASELDAQILKLTTEK